MSTDESSGRALLWHLTQATTHGAFRTVIVVAALALAARARAQAVFYEEGGMVVAEAESARAIRGWKASTKLSGYTGECYYVGAGSGKLTYKIVITNAGTYTLSIRNRHDFAQADKQNDCMTRMDDGKQLRTYSITRGVWNWNTSRQDGTQHSPATFELEPGVHVLEISTRSRGFMIDRFHLYRGDIKTPTATALPETKGGLPEAHDLTKLKQVSAYWKRGMLGSALAVAEKRVDSGDPVVAEEARSVLNALKGFAEARRDKIVRMKGSSPVAAVDLLTELANRFMPSKMGREFMAEAGRWNREPSTVNARQAGVIFKKVKEAAEKLEGQGHARDPVFARRFAREIRTIVSGVRELKAKYSGTAYCSKAKSIAIKFGISVD